MTFTIACLASGDEAEADSASASLVAADQLARDFAEARRNAQGALRLGRKSLAIYQDGQLEAMLTQLARGGHRAPLSAAWSQEGRR